MKSVNEAYEIADIETLQPHPANPRIGNEEAIAESMAENDIYGAAVVQRSTNYILAGNHRIKVAKSRGETTFPVIYVDVDNATALAILLADNKTSDASRGNNDATKLVSILDQITAIAGSIKGSGYDDTYLAALKQSLMPPPPPDDEEPKNDDAIPSTMIKIGDVLFNITGKQYESWDLQLRTDARFRKSEIQKILAKRLGLA